MRGKNLGGIDVKNPKFIFKINRNNSAKIYINKKWLKDVKEVNIHALPFNHTMEIKQYVKENGKLVLENGELKEKTKKYHFE
jgi:hypothetical protein